MVVVFIRNVDTHVPDHGVMSLKSTIWICTLLSTVGQPMVLFSVLCIVVVAARLLPEEAEGSALRNFENERTSSPAEIITIFQNASCNAILSLLSYLLAS